jgi:glucan phosphoethanolaminetransferase (alkaline phosphatase superfamily)
MQRLVDNLPSLWALGLAALFFASDRGARLAPLPIALSLWLSVGFWCGFFAAARWLYWRSRPTLLVTAPLFLFVALLCAVQQIHHRLFGAFIDHDRMPLIQLNWDTIAEEVIRSAGALPVPLVLGAVLATLLPFAVYLAASRRAVFAPLRGVGGVRAAAALSWLCWSVSGFAFHELDSAHTPDLAAHVLVEEIGKTVARSGGSDLTFSEPWTVARAGTASVPAPPETDPAARPNLVLVLLESVRADHLPSYGHHRETMPFVAKLASAPDAFQFEYAYGNATLSYFAMLALLSGMSLSSGYDAFASTPLLWDHLAVRDYESFVVTQSLGYPRYHLDTYMQTPGLSSYLDVGRSRVDDYLAASASDGFVSELRRRILGRYGEARGIARDDAWSLDAFQQRILARDRTRPFFGMWELECTHYPYCYPAEFRRYEPAQAYLHSGDTVGSLRNDYDNALLYSDHMIQQLMRFLAAERLLEDTVVVITSDHGESFLERGVLFHGGTPYVEQTRVPLLLIVPAAFRARLGGAALDALAANRTAPVQSLDLLPTLVDLADGARGTGRLPGDGASLLRPIAADRELRLVNKPSFREARARKRQEARVSRQDGYVVVYGDGRPPERFALDGSPLPGS